MKANITRCNWPGDDQLMITYHDEEWGTPCHDDAKLFEYIVLDSFQAGLSWRTILHKRENFRKAFDNFDPHKIAACDQAKINELLQDTGIVRNKLKIYGTVANAQAFLKTQAEFGTFAKYIWQFVDGRTIDHHYQDHSNIAARDEHSDKMSKDMIKRGFKFVGSTICYAFMQGVGMFNDHTESCYRHQQVAKL